MNETEHDAESLVGSVITAIGYRDGCMVVDQGRRRYGDLVRGQGVHRPVICPETDKLCKDPECKAHGCLEQREDEGEEELKKDSA